MASSTLRLPQISLLLLIIFKISFVLSTRPGAPSPMILNTSTDDFLPKRFLQNNQNHHNNNLESCPFNSTCVHTATDGVSFTLTLQPLSILYDIIDLESQPQTALTISYSSTSTSTDIETGLFLVPSRGPTYRTLDTPATNQFTLVIPQDDIQEFKNGQVQLGVLNNSTGTTTVTIIMTFAASSSSSKSGASLMGVILPVIAALLLIFIFGVCCHYRKKRLEQERRQRAIERHRARGAARRARNGENQQEDGEEEEGLEDTLTEGNINERFPEAEFEHFKSSFPQSTCSVCLEEFQKRVACRQLYCEHMFHSECIRLWLVNQLKKGHAFCPNCNKNMLHKIPEIEGEVPHIEIQERVQAQPIPGH